MKLKIFFILLFSAGCIGFCQDKALHQKLDSVASTYRNIYGFSGTVKIVLGRDPFFEKSYGLANRSFGIKNTPSTRFSINSISKTFTATAILILAEDGLIDLQSPVGDFIPGLTAGWADSVTVHHLLTHTSGLPRESGVQAHEELTFEAQIRRIEQLKLLFTPGERYEYSNAGMTLLGAVIEKASGLDYPEFIEQHILGPLNLENTGYYRGKNVIPNLAVPYRISANGLEFAQRSKHYGDNAGGGLYSTPTDLYQFIQGLEHHKILNPEYTDLMFKPHVQSGETEFEGYAWSIKYFGDEKLYFAAGSGYGTKSVIISAPESGDFIGITSNWGNTPILQLLGDLYLSTKGQNVTLPSEGELAKPSDFEDQVGTYVFREEELTKHLGIKRSKIKLQAIDGRLFLDDELLAVQDGFLKLTYTNELKIEFTGSEMLIDINDNILRGEKLKTKTYHRN